MAEQLHKVSIKKVLGPINAGTAVLLGNDEKTFVMFIGTYEGAAILRELNQETPPRPMTHDLLSYVLSGFDVKVKQIVISDIVDNTFCATLVLEQRCVGPTAEWNGKRNEVRIDARPSDCLVLALKEKCDIFATTSVLEKVHDISEGVQFGGLQGGKAAPGPFGLKELDLSGLKDQLENFNVDDMLEKDPEDADAEEDD
jgi:bifunctional DNase/RNase